MSDKLDTVLEKTEIARRLTNLHYNMRVPLSELARTIEADTATMAKALKADMTARTQRRLSRVLVAEDRVVARSALPENRAYRPNASGARQILLGRLENLRRFGFQVSGVQYYSANTLARCTVRELIVHLITLEGRIKRRILRNASRNRRAPYFLRDGLDVRQWLEMLQISKEDLGP